jgi:uncharacterized repeat protein (TIGR01451 family)
LGNLGEFIVIRLSRARLAQFIAALSAMVRALILTSGSAQAPSTNEGQFHHRRHGRARRATGLHAASMKLTSMAKAVAALATALALSVVGLAVVAPRAEAHTPAVTATCGTLEVNLTNYQVNSGHAETFKTVHHAAVGEPTIPNPYYKPAVAEVSHTVIEADQRFSWTGGPDGPGSSSTPLSDQNNWQGASNYKDGDPLGKVWSASDDKGKASWFFWTTKIVKVIDTPAKPAEGTPTVPNPDYVAAFDEMVSNHDFVAPLTNHVTVTVNGVVVKDVDFGSSFTGSYSFLANQNNPYKVVVTAWDDPDGSQGWTKTFSGTQAGCVTPKLPPTVGFGSQTCTVGDQGQPSLTGGWIVPGTSEGVSTKVMKGDAEVSSLTGLLPGTYEVVASLTDAAHSSWGTLPTGWTSHDGTVSYSVTIGAAALAQCTVDQPKAKITYGNWTGTPTCGNPSIYQTRDVFTAVYSWTDGKWVLGTPVKTGSETATEPMALTADQIKACHPKLPPTVGFGSQTCTVGDQGQPSLTGGQIVLGTSEGVSTKVMKDNAEVSPLTGLLPGTYTVVASLIDAGHSSWGTHAGWTLNPADGTVSSSVTIGAADLAQCTVDQPKAAITYGNWTGTPTCGNPSIYQTRDVFTAVYSWIQGEWVLGAPVKTGSETATEPMALTADQVKACTINLSLTKSVTSDGPYYGGANVTYTLVPHNYGPVDAMSGWSVTEVLPAGSTLVGLSGLSGDGYICYTNLVCISSTTLAGGADGNPITVVVQIPADLTGQFKNVAYVSPAENETTQETNPLVVPTIDTDTVASATDNDAEAIVDVVPPQPESIVITLPNTGTTIPLTWLLAAIGIVAAGVILLGASRFTARGRKN